VSTGPSASGEVRSVQFLRGVAALGVLGFHAASRAGGSFGVGAAGVDIFFVISGFIMWVVTSRKTPTPGQFLARRAERIIPLYWLVTLGTAAAAILVPGAFPAMRPTALHVMQSLVFIPHRDPTGLIAPLIVPGWTLNYEIFFYLLFAATLMAPARLRVWLVSGTLAALVALRPLGDSANAAWATYTDPILLEFAAGLWLGWAWSAERLPGRRTAMLLMGLGVLGLAATAVTGVDVSGARVLLWGLPAAALVTGAVSFERQGAIPRWRVLEEIGNASYSIYLVHGLAISAVLRLMGQFIAAPPLVVFVASILAGVLSGLLSYHLLERPLMRLFNRPGPIAPVTETKSAAEG
jgi:exopolysaccharide production protein ExoZ